MKPWTTALALVALVSFLMSPTHGGTTPTAPSPGSTPGSTAPTSTSGQCGDGIRQASEQCDLGGENGVSGSGCSSTCTINSGCSCNAPVNTISSCSCSSSDSWLLWLLIALALCCCFLLLLAAAAAVLLGSDGLGGGSYGGYGSGYGNYGGYWRGMLGRAAGAPNGGNANQYGAPEPFVPEIISPPAAAPGLPIREFESNPMY